MKIATRTDSDLTTPVSFREESFDNVRTGVTREVQLRSGQAYDVLAVELSQGGPHFWVIGEGFASRVNDGLVYPDLISPTDCQIVDAEIPRGWVMKVNHMNVGSRTIIGLPALMEAGFLERLTNGEEAVVRVFLDLLCASQTDSAV